jgi:hypothetical protein
MMRIATVAALLVLTASASHAQRGARRPELPADTLVRIRMLDGLSSKTSHTGDRFRYIVTEDVKIDGFTWIRSGTRGAGLVNRVKRKGRFGQNGKIDAAFGRINVAANRQAVLCITKKSEAKNDQEKLAAGAAFAGLLVLGPVGLAAGAFVKGEDIEIRKGAELYVATDKSVR